MPGSFWSMPKRRWPVTMAGLSTPPTREPMTRNSPSFFRRTVFSSGMGSVAAFVASWP